MTRKLLLLIMIPVFCIMLSCSSQPGIAGGVDDSGNFLCGSVTGTASAPMKGVAVSLRKVRIQNSGDTCINKRETETGEDGTYRFENIPAARYVVYCRKSSASLAGIVSKVSFDNLETKEVKNCVISDKVSLKGRLLGIPSAMYNSCTLSIPGLEKHVSPDENGFYIFQDIPQGHYDLTAVYNNTVNCMPLIVECNSGSDTVFLRDFEFSTSLSEEEQVRAYSYYPHSLNASYAVEPQTYTSGSEPAWYSGADFSGARYFRVYNNEELVEINNEGDITLLIDDFNDYDNLTLLNQITSHSFWFAYNDSGDGGNSDITPEGIKYDFSLCLTGSGSYSGASACVSYTLNDGFSFPYANIGIEFDTGYVDLSGMSAISFYAKGTGSIRLNFESHAVTSYDQVYRYAQLGYTFDLPSQWQEITISTDSLSTPEGIPEALDTLEWRDVCDSINNIEFGIWETPGLSATLWLDNVYLHGMREDDFRQDE